MIDNPWRNIEYKVDIVTYPKNQKYEERYYKNVIWTNKFYQDHMKYEFLHKPSGKIWKDSTIRLRMNGECSFSLSADDMGSLGEPMFYKSGKTYKDEGDWFNIDDVKVRIEDKLFQKFHELKNLLQIGDFVKCSGTRSGDWNKIESISDRIFGPKYIKPEEGFMRYTSSDNHISKIIKVVRDGQQIWPK